VPAWPYICLAVPGPCRGRTCIHPWPELVIDVVIIVPTANTEAQRPPQHPACMKTCLVLWIRNC